MPNLSALGPFTRKVLIFFLLLILPFSFISHVNAGEYSSEYFQKTASYKEIQLLSNALSILKFASIDNKDKQKFLYSALEGMTESLDRHSYFVPPELVSIIAEDNKDKYVGIGVHIAKTDDGYIEILSIDPDTPAYNAGIKPKDIILSIDGKLTDKMRLIDSIKLLRDSGISAGTKVNLSVSRNGNKEPLNFVLTREYIKIKTIEWKIIEKRYGYLSLRRFYKKTPIDFKKAVQDIESETASLKGLIIDLRNNPGGDMFACIELARLFIKSGTIASLDSNFPELKVNYKAYEDPPYDWPLVVIVDEGSASASELFSGALQFHKRATIIGRKTFGKGTFQNFIPLSNEMGLYITIGKYFLPDGSSVENKGLTPDVIIGKDSGEEMIISKALQIIKSNL